jgi:hypothetical protein
VLEAAGTATLAGIATFADIQRESDPASMKGSNPGTDTGSRAPDGWPATLSGALSWTCQPW